MSLLMKVLLADADDTLFDFRRGERVAISDTFRAFGIPDTPGHAALYHRVNLAQWQRLERGETTQARLRVDRFRDFLTQARLPGDPQALCDFFVERLGCQRFLLPGALAFCQAVSRHIPIYLVTNGIARVQRSRFSSSELAPYIAGLVISEEVGRSKPHPAMVFEALRQAGGVSPRDAAMIGDSVTSDIPAARAAGVKSILFTNGQEPPRGHGADAVARTYLDALALLGLS